MPVHFPRKEDEVQARLVAELRAARVLFCHVPNEGRASQRAAQLRKLAGVVSGVPDLLIFTPPIVVSGFRFVGAAMELKIEPNVVEAEQARWLRQLHECGWAVAVISGPTVEATIAIGLHQLRIWGYLP